MYTPEPEVNILSYRNRWLYVLLYSVVLRPTITIPPDASSLLVLVDGGGRRDSPLCP
jgi:hypothetical protein